jgi:hypothetical protein
LGALNWPALSWNKYFPRIYFDRLFCTFELNCWGLSIFSNTLPKEQASSDDVVEMRAEGDGRMLLCGSGGGILARNEGVRFLVYRTFAASFSTMWQVLPLLVLTAGNQLDDYELVVRTGSQPDAATDVPVTFTLVGSGGRSAVFTVDPGLINGSTRPFRPGSSDTFKFQGKPIGKCQQVVVSLGGSGSIADDFFLAQVTVSASPSSSPSSSLAATVARKFILNGWISCAKGSVTVYPEETSTYEIIIRGCNASLPPSQCALSVELTSKVTAQSSSAAHGDIVTTGDLILPVFGADGLKLMHDMSLRCVVASPLVLGRIDTARITLLKAQPAAHAVGVTSPGVASLGSEGSPSPSVPAPVISAAWALNIASIDIRQLPNGKTFQCALPSPATLSAALQPSAASEVSLVFPCISGPNATIKFSSTHSAPAPAVSALSSSSTGRPIFGLKALHEASSPLTPVEAAASAYFPSALESNSLVFATRLRKEDISCVRFNPAATVSTSPSLL